MEPIAPEKEYPNYGRCELDHAHAPYMIVRSLVRLGLAHWSATLLHWLGRYDGLEEYLHAQCDPACAVRDLLAAHVERWPALADGECLSPQEQRLRIEAVIDDLLELDFVAARAHWGPLLRRGPTVWNPVQEDWMWFLLLGPGWESVLQAQGEDHDVLQVWTRSQEDIPYKQAIRAMLLQGMNIGRCCGG